MAKQRTLEEYQWRQLIEAHEKAPHGYKLKAEQRLKDHVAQMLRNEQRTSARKAA